MKIIPPYQITSEILNLINESEKYLIIVSPYVNFKNWDRIKIDIKNALKRNVQINFYTRFDNENFKSWEEIEALGIKPKLIKNLHAKLYFNEKSGIVTSMNLLTSSNLNAIEFGSIYNTESELTELRGFVKKYLESNLEKEKPNDEDLYLAKEKFDIVLSNFLSHHLERYVSCRWNNGVLNVNANNQYFMSIDKVKKLFSVSGIISGYENDSFGIFYSKNKGKFKTSDIFVQGEKGCMASAVLLTKKSFTSSNFDFLSVFEKKEILDISLNFIRELKSFKDDCYKNRKASF
ncbi:phospholipase D-like domain-containing protein [Lutibacter sp.]